MSLNPLAVNPFQSTRSPAMHSSKASQHRVMGSDRLKPLPIINVGGTVLPLQRLRNQKTIVFTTPNASATEGTLAQIRDPRIQVATVPIGETGGVQFTLQLSA